MSEDDIDEVAHPEWTDDEEEEDWEEREQKVALKEEIVEAVDKLVSAVTELKKPRKTRVKKENISDDDVKVTVPAASKKPAAKKKPKDLRTVFRALLKTLDIEKLKRPWMASKVLRRVDSAQELEGWVEKILHDTSLHHPTPSGQVLPVVACDTETITLDTRVMIDLVQARDTSGNEVWVPIYEVKMEIAGICLSADGIEGIYVPINHADGHNVSREDCHRILQHLFNNCHLVFYHAKFDREVIRQTLGIDMRPYPFFEDVQVFNYLNDPKADLGDQKKGQYTGDTGGLKNLSLIKLGIDQIELDQIGKVSADFFNPETGKTTTRIQYVPFTWIPTDIAYWYAASDAICTWLLWWQLKDEARKLKLVHRIDHELVDSLTWIERQRYIVDTDRHKRTVKWHQAKLEVDRARLRGIAIEAGYKEEDGEQFNPDSNKQMAKLLFQTMKLRVLRRSKKTQDPSCDAETISDLAKIYPDNIFLKTYGKYKAYVSLHPENLHFDPKDHTARIYLRSCVVAGGRLSATGGKYEVDGGFGLNIQGIKRVEGNWWVKGNVLEPDNVDPESVEEHAPEDLHPSCWKTEERTIKTKIGEEPVLDWDTKPMVDKDGRAIVKEIFDSKKEEYKVKAPNIIKNHIGQYLGYAICLVPGCKTCAKNYGILIENGRMDANEVINLRAMFKAPTGWTFATIDYCVSPGTKILTSDLHWKRAEDVVLGEELVGFDENPAKYRKRRQFHGSLVEHVEKLRLPCVKITTNHGEIICYKRHGWLSKMNVKGDNFRFINSENLQPGNLISRLCHTWEESHCYEAGYLSGVYDGEGHIPTAKSAASIEFAQKPGIVLDETRRCLSFNGFSFRDNEDDLRGYDNGVVGVYLEGGRPEFLRFLGSIRPKRLLVSGRKLWEGTGIGSRCMKSDVILSVEDVGEQEVIAIRTSTHTFVAEGLLSHNCNVEMRVAANISGEPEFIKEFLEGSGDFHSLTASKVFPEFNDPNIDKATKKSYRALAKILNFALLYGGTAYTIFENMKKKDPNITFEHAQEMVDAYWAGVPVFREYCDRKQAIAKEKMTCQTATGRIIKFDSAMSALGIHNPTKHEMDNYWEYRRLDKAATLAEKSKDKETFRELRDRADIMWKTPETGVRNVGDYNQFMGKIQRVAVNVPMQGLAGDFMRITLNRIRKWAAEKDPMVQAVLLMHGSVHDEIDFSFKNEYAPFILPRLTRLMKLRKYHASMNWRVPLECDTEYGRSWDVEHHLTGDDGHKPAGWSEIPGMENYVPEEFDIDTVRALLTALKSGDEKRREKVKGWLKENLHSRAFEEASKHIFAAKDGKEMRKYLIIGLQLHEFWKTDEIPEDQDDKLETLEQFEARCGLTPADRGLMPVFGYIGAIPLDINVKRPELPILGEDEQLEIQFTTDIPKPITLEDREQIAEQAREIVERKQVVSIVEELNKKLDTKLDDEDNLRSEIGKLHKQIAEAEGTQIDENELLLDIPVRKVVVKPPEAKPEPKPNLKLPAKADIPELRNLTAADAKALRESLGIGTNKVKAMYQGQVITFTDVDAIRVPDSFIRE